MRRVFWALVMALVLTAAVAISLLFSYSIVVFRATVFCIYPKTRKKILLNNCTNNQVGANNIFYHRAFTSNYLLTYLLFLS